MVYKYNTPFGFYYIGYLIFFRLVIFLVITLIIKGRVINTNLKDFIQFFNKLIGVFYFVLILEIDLSEIIFYSTLVYLI